MPKCDTAAQVTSPSTTSSSSNCSSNGNNASKTVGGYKEVCIIGNGPSGLCLSYFLSGHWPYWNKNQVLDEYLQIRLQSCDNGLSLVEQDLEYLSDGLEGRSNNPVALLFDKLKHPDGDMGLELPSCLNWVYDPLKEIDHVCIGKAAGPGGAWNDLDGSQLTISPSRWMELPDMSYSDWKRQTKTLANNNAGLIFSAKNSNFSEDNSLLNGNTTTKSVNKNLYKQLPNEDSRASMHDVRNYYRDYARQKNLDKYLLNNATVTNVKRICCSKVISSKNHSSTSNQLNENATGQNLCWEITGIIDKRDRKKASSLTHKGDLMEFRFFSKYLVLANGATDLHNELKVKGENLRFILRSIRELEDKIKEDLPRLQKDPLLIVGSGLSAADAILLAQKYHIKIIHVIRRSVHDPNLIFNKLPKKVYPEYQRVYEQMLHNRFTTTTSTSLATTISNTIGNEQLIASSDKSTSISLADSENTSMPTQTRLRKPLSQSDFNQPNNQYNANNDTTIQQTNLNSKGYILYDEHQVKCFTSKRTCQLIDLKKQQQCEIKTSKCLNVNFNRHLHIQKNHHQHHQRQLNEFDEECELSKCSENDCLASSTLPSMSTLSSGHQQKCLTDDVEIKISYACILIGYTPDLNFMPAHIVKSLALDNNRILNTKDNPISINPFTYETEGFKDLFAMGPLVGDNFVRFGTGGALAICSSIYKSSKLDKPNLNK